MIEYLDLLVVTVLILIVVLGDWRRGVYAFLAVGFLQDPARKLVAGEPVAMQVLVLLVVVATALVALARGVRFDLQSILRDDRRAYWSLLAFSAFVVAQSFACYLRFGSPMVAGIGLIAYLSPLGAVWLGYSYPRSRRDVESFLRWYCVGAVGVAFGVLCSLLGFDWRVLGEVGEGLVVFTYGRMTTAHAGFMRTPEVAAWHLAAGACLISLLAVGSRRTDHRLWGGALFGALVAAGLLTARRKILVEIALYLVIFGCFAQYFRQRSARAGIVLLGAGALACLVAVGAALGGGEAREFDTYVRRGRTVGSAALGRLEAVGLRSVSFGLQRGGLLGLGAGAGSQGSQHFGAAGEGAAEGGLGKIAVELGLFGLALSLWIATSFARVVWTAVQQCVQGDPVTGRLAFGLVAFLVANTAVFLIATQIFGDPFVLLVLGFLLGMLLALPGLPPRPIGSERGGST